MIRSIIRTNASRTTSVQGDMVQESDGQAVTVSVVKTVVVLDPGHVDADTVIVTARMSAWDRWGGRGRCTRLTKWDACGRTEHAGCAERTGRATSRAGHVTRTRVVRGSGRRRSVAGRAWSRCHRTDRCDW